MSKEAFIEKHFPVVDPGARPTGNQVMVQLRTIQKQSKGGIVLVEETKEFNQGTTQVALLVKTGQIAYHDRSTGELWKEGAWATVGDVVIAPRYGGYRFEVPVPGTEDKALFAVINDFDLKMVIESNFEAFTNIL